MGGEEGGEIGERERGEVGAIEGIGFEVEDGFRGGRGGGGYDGFGKAGAYYDEVEGGRIYWGVGWEVVHGEQRRKISKFSKENEKGRNLKLTFVIYTVAVILISSSPSSKRIPLLILIFLLLLLFFNYLVSLLLI